MNDVLADTEWSGIATDAGTKAGGPKTFPETIPHIRATVKHGKTGSDGNELRKTVAASPPDVIVTDIWMPPSGADEGLRVAMSLRETHPEIGVVVLSLYAEPAYASPAPPSRTSP